MGLGFRVLGLGFWGLGLGSGSLFGDYRFRVQVLVVRV